jgi:hypothetical protein
MRITIKAINEELKRLGHDTQLAKGDGYYYFTSGETANWLDRTVRVATVSSLTLEQWVEEFQRLKKFNADFLRGKMSPRGEQIEAESRPVKKSKKAV